MIEVRIPVRIPPQVKEGWTQLLAYVPEKAAMPLNDLAIVIISHLPVAKGPS